MVMHYNLSGNIRVYCRVRPFLGGHSNRPSTVDRIDEGSMSIISPSKYSKEGRKSFSFNKVFGPSATQGSPTSFDGLIIYFSFLIYEYLVSTFFLCRGSICGYSAFDPVCA